MSFVAGGASWSGERLGPSACQACGEHISANELIPNTKAVFSASTDATAATRHRMCQESPSRSKRAKASVGFWYGLTCSCVFHEQCLSDVYVGTGNLECPNHHTQRLRLFTSMSCLFGKCIASGKDEVLPLCREHITAVTNKIWTCVDRHIHGAVSSNGLAARTLYLHITSLPSIVPRSVIEAVAHPADSSGGHIPTDSEITEDITPLGHFVRYVHPYIKIVWYTALTIVLTNPQFWCERIRQTEKRGSGTLWVRLSYARIASYFVSDAIPRVIRYSDVWSILANRKEIVSLPEMNRQKSMLVFFRTAVSSGKIPLLIPVDSFSFRKRTRFNCYSPAKLTICLVEAGHCGIPLRSLLLEDERIPDMIDEMVKEGYAYMANRKVYSTSFARQLPVELKDHFKT